MKTFLVVIVLLALCVGTGISSTTPAFGYTTQCTDVVTALASYSTACIGEITNLSSIAVNPTGYSEEEICSLIYDLLDCFARQITSNDVTQASACLSIMTSVSTNLSSVLVAMNVAVTDPTANAFISTVDCGSYYISFMSANYGMASTYPSYPSTTYSYPSTTYSYPSTTYSYPSTTYSYLDLSACYDVAVALGNYSFFCPTQLLAISQLPDNNNGTILCDEVLEILKCLAYQITFMDPSEYYNCLNFLTSANGNLTHLLGVLTLSNVTIPADLQVTALSASCEPIYSSHLSAYNGMSSTYSSYPSTTYSYSSTTYSYSDLSACYDVAVALGNYSFFCPTQLLALSQLPDNNNGTILCDAVLEILECLAYQITFMDPSQYYYCLNFLTSANGNLTHLLGVLTLSNVTIPADLQVTALSASCEPIYSSHLSGSSVMPSTSMYYSGTTFTMTSSSSFMIDWDACFNITKALTSHYGNCLVKLTALLTLPDTTTETLCGAVFEIFECLSGQITSSDSSYEYGSCLDSLAYANSDLTALLGTVDVLLNGIIAIPTSVRTTASGANCSSTYSSLSPGGSTYSSTPSGTIDYSEAIPCSNNTECSQIVSHYYCGMSGYCRISSPDDSCTLTVDCGDSLLDCIAGHCHPIKKNCTRDEDCFSFPFKYCKNDTEHQHPVFAGTGLCVPHICSTVAECSPYITDPQLTCEEGMVCGCSEGFEEKEGICERVIGSPCSINNECNLDGAYCMPSQSTCACETSELGDTCWMASTQMISPTPTTDFPMSSTAGPMSGQIDCADVAVVIAIIANSSSMAACFNPLLTVSTQESFCTSFNASLNCLALQLMPSNPEACLLLMQTVAYPSAGQILALLPLFGINLTAEVTGFANNAYVACLNSTAATTSATPTSSPASGSDCSNVATVGDSILGPAAACQASFASILTATTLNDYCSYFTAGLKCMAPVLRPGDETRCLKEMKTEIHLNATALLDYILLNVLSVTVTLPTLIQNFAQSSGNCALETSDRAVICSADSHCTDMWPNLYCGPSQICRKAIDSSCSVDSDCSHTLLRCLEDSSNAPSQICTPVIEECGPISNCSGEPLTSCDSTHDLGYQDGYCKPKTCTDNSTCTLANTYCTLDGACDCIPGFYFIDRICTDTFVTEVTYTVGMLYTNGYPLVQHKCGITDTLVGSFTYEVKWIRLDQAGSPLEVVKVMPVTSSTPAESIVLNDNELSNTYILNDKLACNVSVKDSSGTEIQPPVSSPALKLLEVLNTTVSLNRGEKKKFCFRLGFPYACQPGESCSFDFMAYDTTDNNSCSAMSLAMSGNETCGCKATPKTQADVTSAGGWLSYTPETFCCYITTKNEFKRSFSGSKTLNLKTAFRASSLPVPYVEGDLTQTVSATVTDPFTGIPSCKLFSNGYLWTFDNKYISLRGGSATARYIAYKHTETHTEIQIGMKQSQSNNLPEITSVFVRSGMSVAKILHSSTDHQTVTLQSSADGTDRFRFFKLNNNLYALRLPQGTEVVINIESEYGFSLTGAIFASPSDASKTTGLCGNLDGDASNDPTDGNIGTWIATDNYDLSAVRESLSGWTNEDQKCVCSTPYTVNDRICSVMDDGACSGGLITPQYGSQFNQQNTRRRRSAEEGLDYELFGQPGKLSAIFKDMVEAHPISKRDAASCDTELQAICPMLDNNLIFSAADRTQVVNTQCGAEANSSVDWARLSCTPLQIVAFQSLYRDDTVKTSNPEYQHICVGGCLNNGTCSNGQCQCTSDFKGDNCHLNITEPIVVISEPRIEVSLIQPPTCYNLTSSNGFSSTATCRAIEFVAVFELSVDLTDRISFRQSTVTFSLLTLFTTYEGQCCPPATGRRRRSAGATNSQIQISVSNDGETYSDPIVVTTIDSTCQNITTVNGSTYIELLSGYCFIDGVCYNDSDANPSLSCQYCTTSHNVFNWNDTCVYNTGGDKDDGLPGYAIALIVIFVLMAVAGVAAAVYILVLKKKLHQRIGDFFGRGIVREPTNSKFMIVRKDADMNAAWKDPNGVPGITDVAWQPQQ